MKKFLCAIIPAALGIAVLALWQFAVRSLEVPVYILPAPSDIALALRDNFSSLMASLGVTLWVTVQAFVLAVLGGVALAILFSQSRTAERALYPYAVIVQVTPVVGSSPPVFTIGGLTAFTTQPGNYVLSVNAAGLVGANGAPGVGSN